ncbi:MAG: hypothetical protein NWT00_10705, partial [Beijerinckiaceae bacterium]|nr:hypothetical protein [Beijerinckiaceae bacterium]
MIDRFCTLAPTHAEATLLDARINALPERVAAMREKLLEAAEEQDLNKLRACIERNEVMPLFGAPGKRPKRFSEAIDFRPSWAGDGQGRGRVSLRNAILPAPAGTRGRSA